MIGTGVMSALLEHGADASATEPNRGATALHLAATNPQARGAAAALLKHGADAWAKDKAGDTPTDRHHQCVAEARTTGASRAVEADVEAKADAAQAASEPAPEGSTAGAGGGEDETPAAALLLLPDIDPAARRGDALRRADWTAIGTGHFTEGKHELAAQHLYVASQVYGFASHVWFNLGHVLTVVAMRRPTATRGATLRAATVALLRGGIAKKRAAWRMHRVAWPVPEARSGPRGHLLTSRGPPTRGGLRKRAARIPKSLTPFAFGHL